MFFLPGFVPKAGLSKLKFAVGFTNYSRQGNSLDMDHGVYSPFRLYSHISPSVGIAVSSILRILISSFLEISLSLFSLILKNSIFRQHTSENKIMDKSIGENGGIGSKKLISVGQH